MHRKHQFGLVLLALAAIGTMSVWVAGAGLSGKFDSDYYDDWPLFHMYPNEKDARWSIDRIGPVGLGLDLLQPAFTMKITKVEPGSPAAATGKLKPGLYIQSINGQTLKGKDPRVILGNLITEAEAKDGILKMMVKDAPDAQSAREVVVKIPVMGKYADTAPLNCEKSDKIVRQFADFLAEHPRGWGSALFLLSTGEEKDLDVVRGWYSGKLKAGPQGFPWSIGYEGPAICEYYLRTGDESVLPAIQGMCDYLTKTIYNGSWMGRGGANYGYMAGGHMNAAGVHCLTFLLLAKECGVDVDEYTLQSCLYHFYRYVGHWNVSYGDGLPEGGGVDNGKNGGLAFAMAAAASLMPDGENSVYAKARDIQANKSFYTTSWLFHGHTGGGIGELWRGAAMGLLYDKRPEPYRSFFNERMWMYELARGHDGAFGWPSGWNVNYGATGHKGGKAWGNYIPLVYTVPRKNLRIFGAPPTEFSKPYKLPERPWGTKADEAFYSLEAGEYAPGKRHDMEAERLPTHSAWPILRKFKDPNVSDETLLEYALHPDSTSRSSAAGAIREQGRQHLAMQLLRSDDPRGRLSGIKGLSQLDDEAIKLLGGIISDPDESWWVAREAMVRIADAPADKIAPYFDALEQWLQHKDWWLRHAAMQALTPLAAHPDYYKKILPIVGDMVATNQRAVALSPLGGIVKALQDADPQVQRTAVEVLGEAYAKFPTELHAPGGQDLSAGADYLLQGIARNLAATPGGFDKLYEVSRERFADDALPHQSLYLRADPDKFGPKVKEAFKPLVLNYLIPKYIGGYNHIATNSDLLRAEAASEKMKGNFYYREPRMAELVRLYNRIGIHKYDWHVFGPDLDEITWQYHTFDPPEKKIWEPGWRYRKVTYPAGMADWYKTGFDAKAAGWKTGKAPIGSFDGKLVTEKHDCGLDFCRCGEPMNTLWEKEVLLMRTKLKLPPFKQGHRYRLVIGGMSHVNRGDGFRVYVNGKLMIERKRGVGKREGGRPICYYIDKDWWPAFENEVTIAATSFLSIPPGKRSPGVPKNHFSIWFQEMTPPPITDEVVIRGKSLQPMLCSTWQASRDDEDRFSYDGNFTANDKLAGRWTLVGQTDAVEDFDPAQAAKPDGAPFESIQIKSDGTTDKPLIVWSGNMLMDLNRYQALEMKRADVGGQTYLFIERGGFDKKRPDDWRSPWLVLQSKP